MDLTDVERVPVPTITLMANLTPAYASLPNPTPA